MSGNPENPFIRREPAVSALPPRSRRPRGSRPDFSHPAEMVTFIVGREEKRFTVHKEFICYYSEPLKAMFNGPFIEGRTQTLTLDYLNVEVFELFLQWIYTQKLEPHEYSAEAVREFVQAAPTFFTHRTDGDLAELWILADKYLIPSLQNLIMDVLAEMTKRTWGQKSISSDSFPWIWKHTSDDVKESKLRLWVMQMCFLMGPGRFKKRPQDFPRELLLDYAAFATAMLREDSDDLDDLDDTIIASDYHVSLSRDGYN